MVEIKFEVCRGRISKIVVENYEFTADAPKETIDEIEELFRKLSKLGVSFKREEEKEEKEKLKEFVRLLTERQKCILRQFKNRDTVKMDELKNKCGDLRGPLAGLTQKARNMGLIDKDEVALEPDWENKVYRLNPKLRKVVDLL